MKNLYNATNKNPSIREFSYRNLIHQGKAKRYYSPGVREEVHGLKQSEEKAIKFAGLQMSHQVSCKDVLVPTLSRNGRQGHALLLALGIQKWSGARIFTGLRGRKRESVYDLKKKGMNPFAIDFGYKLTQPLPKAKRYWVVDNVIGTGATMNAMCRVIGKDARPLVYAVDDFVTCKKLCQLDSS